MKLRFEDWEEFERRFPDAMAWIRARSLRRELELLRGIPENRRTPWEERRLTELEKWEKTVKEIQEA